MAAHLVRDPLHTTLMPPIPRTRSLYELPKRDSQDYRFRNTVAFWIAVSFVEGSLLFICGALASALALREAWKQRGLVEFAYFAGSLFYTLGSYLGFFQVINLGRDRIRLFACSGTSREAYWGSLLYLAGALFFNVGCVEGLLPTAVRTRRLFWGLYYTPFVAVTLTLTLTLTRTLTRTRTLTLTRTRTRTLALTLTLTLTPMQGAACFVLGALIECKLNAHVRAQLTLPSSYP